MLTYVVNGLAIRGQQNVPLDLPHRTLQLMHPSFHKGPVLNIRALTNGATA